MSSTTKLGRLSGSDERIIYVVKEAIVKV